MSKSAYDRTPHILPVILAGTGLWPLSLMHYAKKYLGA